MIIELEQASQMVVPSFSLVPDEARVPYGYQTNYKRPKDRTFQVTTPFTLSCQTAI